MGQTPRPDLTDASKHFHQPPRATPNTHIHTSNHSPALLSKIYFSFISPVSERDAGSVFHHWQLDIGGLDITINHL
jgi:hypothetical protein